MPDCLPPPCLYLPGTDRPLFLERAALLSDSKFHLEQKKPPKKTSQKSTLYPAELFYRVLALNTGEKHCLSETNNYFHRERIAQSRLFKVWQYQHAWQWIKMFTRLVLHSRLCRWGPVSVCKCITLGSLRLAVKLIKAPCGAATEGLPQFNAILHGGRWTISLTAGVTQLWQIHQSGQI